MLGLGHMPFEILKKFTEGKKQKPKFPDSLAYSSFGGIEFPKYVSLDNKNELISGKSSLEDYIEKYNDFNFSYKKRRPSIEESMDLMKESMDYYKMYDSHRKLDDLKIYKEINQKESFDYSKLFDYKSVPFKPIKISDLTEDPTDSDESSEE